jgi:hypothetical protein
MVKDFKKQIKGVFIPPVKKYYFGKLKYGTPYFYPWGFNSTIIYIRKLKLREEKTYAELAFPWRKEDCKFSNFPMVRRIKNWVIKIFKSYYYIEIGSPIKIAKGELGWKDKYDTPRYEWSPFFMICFFKWQFCIHWNSPDDDNNDTYYEMILWYLYYSNKDINKAEKTWDWVEGKTKKSTWNNKYLINRL